MMTPKNPPRKKNTTIWTQFCSDMTISLIILFLFISFLYDSIFSHFSLSLIYWLRAVCIIIAPINKQKQKTNAQNNKPNIQSTTQYSYIFNTRHVQTHGLMKPNVFKNTKFRNQSNVKIDNPPKWNQKIQTKIETKRNIKSRPTQFTKDAVLPNPFLSDATVQPGDLKSTTTHNQAI